MQLNIVLSGGFWLRTVITLLVEHADIVLEELAVTLHYITLEIFRVA